MQSGRRSAIPRVLGILMIVFGSLGVLGMALTMTMAFGAHDDGYGVGGADMAHLLTYEKISSVVNLALAALDVFAGIALVRYRRVGVNLAQLYGLTNIVVAVVSLVLLFTLLAPLGAMLGGGLLGGSALTIAWSIVVLVLSNVPAAKLACTNV